MTRLGSAILVLLAGAASAGAQTIRPVLAEYRDAAHGRFEVVNNGDRPLNVVIEPRGFTIDDDGQMRDEPLPASIQLRLSATSFRLPPRQGRFVFYEATAGSSPAWLVFYAAISGFPARDTDGVNVQLELPHIVYVLPKARLRAEDVHVTARAFDAGTATVALDLDNRGANFGRLTSVVLKSATHRVRVPGFALLPGGRRHLEVAWPGDEPPERITVDGPGLSIEQALDVPIARP